MNIIDRFKKYIAFDTMASETSGTHPSNFNELVFGDMLIDDLKELGVNDITKTNEGYVYAYVSNSSKKTIGLIAHMDTSPDFRGGIKNPKIIERYDGGIIKLNDVYQLDPEKFKVLNDVIGEKLIVTDGEHLLGGDDKAGIAIIFAFLEYYLKNKDEFNYNLAICFTPDEEIGEGPLFFEVDKMRADIAFTLDGESIYEANFENFNAKSAYIEIKGLGVHPGNAKDTMVNAGLIASFIASNLPLDKTPFKTDGYDGFIHLCSINGDVENASMHFILREHDNRKLEYLVDILRKTCDLAKKTFLISNIILEFKDQYKNMAPEFIKDPRALKMINNAYLSKMLKLKYTPIRGGTDGATITYKGLPCPNLGVGDFNPHGRFEFVSLTQMEQMVDILKELFKGTTL